MANGIGGIGMAGMLVACAGPTGETGDTGAPPDGNAPPVAVTGSFTTWMGTPLTGQLDGEDADSDALTFQVAVPPEQGTLQLEPDGSFTYAPDPGAAGADAFAFVVSDGEATSGEAVVGVQVETLTDGTLDTGFGSRGGAVVHDFGEIDTYSGVAVRDDGRVLAVGNHASSEWLIGSYTRTGQRDARFGDGGSLRIDRSLGYDGLGDVALQSTGRAVAVGQVQEPNNRNFVLVGLASDGLDASFGTDGVTATDVGGGDNDVANALLVMADDRLLVAGYADGPDGDDFAVARYTADGALDRTFGVMGATVVDLSGATDRASDLAIDAQGRILLVGESATGGGDIGVVRLLADGSPDPDFGTGGVIRIDLGDYEDGRNIVVGPDGAIWIGGSITAGGALHMAILRLRESGQLDTNFADGGVALVDDTGTDSTYMIDMLGLPNGTLLLAGTAEDGPTTLACLARLLPTGGMDPSFGEGGLFTRAFGSGGDDKFFALALQDDGRVVAAGWSRNADIDGLVVRFAW